MYCSAHPNFNIPTELSKYTSISQFPLSDATEEITIYINAFLHIFHLSINKLKTAVSSFNSIDL